MPSSRMRDRRPPSTDGATRGRLAGLAASGETEPMEASRAGALCALRSERGDEQVRRRRVLWAAAEQVR